MKPRFFRILSVCFMAFVTASVASGQSASSAKPKAFTNADVLKLKTASFSDDEIVGAIQVAQNKSFDVSGDGLTALKQAGVSKRVMAAILGIPYTPEAVPAPATAPTIVTQPEPPQAKPVASSIASPTDPKNATKASKLRFIRRVPGLGKTAENAPATAPSAAAAVDKPGDPTLLPTPRRGEPVVFTVSMSTDNACTKVRQYFVTNDAELESSDCAVGQLRTHPTNKKGWVFDSRKRAVVDFVETSGGTEVRVKVVARGSGSVGMNGKLDSTKTEGDARESVRVATNLRKVLLAGKQT
jgi:hypothetical protein